MSAKDKVKGEQRRIRRASPKKTPIHAPGKINTAVSQKKDTAKDDLWNRPFNKIKGLRLMIPHSQIRRDKHQPRIDFESKQAKVRLQGLARSIKRRGLQQPVMVNYFKRVDGKNVFVIDKGERRWRAHIINEMESVDCLVQLTTYNGKLSLDRVIDQFAENFRREIQTTKETIRVFRLIYEKRVKETSEKYGAIKFAIETLAESLGSTISWATQFSLLMRLTPEFIDLLDPKEEGVPAVLNFHAGIALSAVPQENQKKVFRQSLVVLKEHGLNAQRSFIAREARQLREKKGEKMRGRVKDERERMLSIPRKLKGITRWLSDGKTPGEFHALLKEIVGSLGGIAVDALLKDLKDSLATFVLIENMAHARRTVLFEELGLQHTPERKPSNNQPAVSPKVKAQKKESPKKTEAKAKVVPPSPPAERVRSNGEVAILEPDGGVGDNIALPEALFPENRGASSANRVTTSTLIAEQRERRALATDFDADDDALIRQVTGSRY